MNRLDAHANPAQIARLLAAARKNAECLAAIDDSDRATFSRDLPESPALGSISIPGYQLANMSQDTLIGTAATLEIL